MHQSWFQSFDQHDWMGMYVSISSFPGEQSPELQGLSASLRLPSEIFFLIATQKLFSRGRRSFDARPLLGRCPPRLESDDVREEGVYINLHIQPHIFSRLIMYISKLVQICQNSHRKRTWKILALWKFSNRRIPQLFPSCRKKSSYHIFLGKKDNGHAV